MDRIKEVLPSHETAPSINKCTDTRPLQKMVQLRAEADEAQAKVDELQTEAKGLKQDNLSKEQEIKSLTHKNQVLTDDVEKFETEVKENKKLLDESGRHGQQNETLQRRLQLLEEEAEEADKNLREANEKCVQALIPSASTPGTPRSRESEC